MERVKEKSSENFSSIFFQCITHSTAMEFIKRTVEKNGIANVMKNAENVLYIKFEQKLISFEKNCVIINSYCHVICLISSCSKQRIRNYQNIVRPHQFHLFLNLATICIIFQIFHKLHYVWNSFKRSILKGFPYLWENWLGFNRCYYFFESFSQFLIENCVKFSKKICNFTLSRWTFC